MFFTDQQQLTSDAGALPGKPDLYECVIAAGPGGLGCVLSDLTPLHGKEPGDVQGQVLGASEDGSWLYFVANGH